MCHARHAVSASYCRPIRVMDLNQLAATRWPTLDGELMMATVLIHTCRVTLAPLPQP